MGAASDQQRAANAETLDYYVTNSLPLPAGTIEVDASGGAIQIPTARTIAGDPLGTVLDVYPKAPTAGWMLFDSVAQGGVMELRDLTIHGPTSIPDGYTESVLRNTDIFRWIGSGTLIVDNLTVTGLPARAVQFSGVGDCTITNSTLSGYVSPIARWESNDSPTPGSLSLAGCTLTGVGSGSTSVGIYVHPHIPVSVTGSTFEDFARYGVYQNGSPPDLADILIEDSSFLSCAVIFSSGGCTATIRRILWEGVTAASSIIGGDAIVEDSVIRSGPWAAVGDGQSISFRGCQWGPGSYRVLTMGPTVNGSVTFTDCTIADTATTGHAIEILGAVTLDRTGLSVTTARPATFWNLGPNVIVI